MLKMSPPSLQRGQQRYYCQSCSGIDRSSLQLFFLVFVFHIAFIVFPVYIKYPLFFPNSVFVRFLFNLFCP